MTDAPELRAGSGTLSAAAGHITAARAEFDGHSARLRSLIDDMRAQWGGQGATAFHRVHEAWQTRQHTIVAALDDFADSLRLTESDNTGTDQDQAAAMNVFAADPHLNA